MSNIEKNWSVAIICSRESTATLMQCLLSAVNSCGSSRATIDIVVNGNQSLASEISAALVPRKEAFDRYTIRVWSIAYGDKANAWNEYVHRIWPGDTDAFFLDGYAQVRPDAFDRLSRSLHNGASLFGATGVPSSGRSAEKLRKQMLSEGGLHGNMHLILASAMAEMRNRGIRLPSGLYRTDALIGALLMFSLDPKKNAWDPSRIIVDGAATWEVPEITRITLSSVKSQIKRALRQAQGNLENRAVRQHLAVQNRAPELLPNTSKELVNLWISAHVKDAFLTFIKYPLSIYAAYKLQGQKELTALDRSAVLIQS